jgi:hypothetical protein
MRAEAKNRWRFEPNDLSTREALIIAFALLLIFGLFVAFGPDVNVKFGGLTTSTLVLFGYLVHDSRRYLRNPRFWILTASLLVLHLFLWITILTRVEKWGLLWFNVMVFELPVFWYLRSWPGLLD